MRRIVLVALAGLAAWMQPASAQTAVSPAEAASQALARQASVLGVSGATVSVPRHASLREAVSAFLASKGALTDDAVDTLQTLDGLPSVRQAALTRVVDAYIAFDAAAAKRIELAQTQGLGAGLGELLAARRALFDASAALSLPVTPDSFSSASPVQFLPWFSLSLGDFDNVYTNDVALLIDEAGDDRYLNNAGGSNLHGGLCELGAVVPTAASALIDEVGTDGYGSTNAMRSCGANGGGAALRAGFLYDGGLGGDSFTAGSFGVNGGGDFGGVGFLYDEAGDSTYTAGGNGVNGGGSLGTGLLVDSSGNDMYTGLGNGVNGGGQLGVGGLVDQEGDDWYIAGGFGTNGGANGGVGYLVDLLGDDNYQAASTGVNGGGSAGTGLLLDYSGTDVYDDLDGGTGVNTWLVPKGAFGAQVDVNGIVELRPIDGP